VTDVHLRALQYRTEYLETFIGVTSGLEPQGFVNKLTGEVFEDKKSCLVSLLTNNQVLLESLQPALGSQGGSSSPKSQLLRARDLGVVRLPLKEVRAVCQIGSDASPEVPVRAIIVGLRADSTAAAFLVSLRPTSSAKGRTIMQTAVKELEEGLLDGLATSDIMDLDYCEETEQLVVGSSQGVALHSLLEASGSITTKKLRVLAEGAEGTRLLRVVQGAAFVSTDGHIKVHDLTEIDVGAEANETAVSVREESSASKPKGGPGEPAGAVNPDKVTVEDIERYEALMKGKAVAAASNAHAPRGLVAGKHGKPPLFTRHTWLTDGERELGPL
jgi:hypothetical protein